MRRASYVGKRSNAAYISIRERPEATVGQDSAKRLGLQDLLTPIPSTIFATAVDLLVALIGSEPGSARLFDASRRRGHVIKEMPYDISILCAVS